MKRKKAAGSLLLSAVMLGVTSLPAAALGRGWTAEGDSWCYYDASGSKLTDSWIVDKIGTTPNLIAYYLDMDGKWDEAAVYTGCEGSWTEDGTGWWFQRTDKTYPKDEFEYINSRWYFFNSAGYMETGLIKNEETGNFHYFYPDGAMAEDTGWITLSDGKWIYVEGKHCIADRTTPDGFQMDENAIWRQGGEQTISSDILALTIPASWEGKYVYTILEDGSIRLCEKNSYENNFGGQIMTVRVDTEEGYASLSTIFDGLLVKRENGKVCFATYPTGAQWAPEWKDVYDALYKDQKDILQSVVIK